MTLTRKSGLRRTGFLKRSGKLKKSNPARQAKRRKGQASKHRKYMASETRKVVDARANGRCETDVSSHPMFGIEVREPAMPRNPFVAAWSDNYRTWSRCEREAKIHHHRTYARYGGQELPEDMLKVCSRCHDALEAAKPAGNRFTRSRQ